MADTPRPGDDWLDLSHVESLSQALHDSPEVARRRRESFDLYRELPIEPNPLYRKYGYFAGVDLSSLEFEHRTAAAGAPAPYDGRIQVVHDGAGTRVHLPADLSASGVTVEPLGGDSKSNAPGALVAGEPPADRLTALARTLANRGYVLTIPPRVGRPVLVHDYTIVHRPHQALSVRRSIRVGAGSTALVSEELYSDGVPNGQRFAASAVDLDVGEGARAVYSTLHAPDPRVVSVYERGASVGAHARLAWLWSGLGGFRTRAKNRTLLPGTGAVVDDLQAFYGDGEQSYDSEVTLVHIGTDTHGQSMTRGVFRDQSRGISRGLVRIEKEARKTLSFLSEHAMLLSRGARSDTIPILEILCRDVKATHSSSVAPVDPEKVFYLESRGFSPEESVRTIAEGFLGHVLGRAPIEGLRDTVGRSFEARWNREPIVWRDGAYPVLPAIEIASGEAGADWRFDSKLTAAPSA